MGNYTEQLNEELKAQQPNSYTRSQLQSYMTAPEWRNVEISEHLSEFLKEGNSLFHFSYLAQIRDIWVVLYQSYVAARRYDSAWDVLFSEYMMMDLFVATFTTSELLPKVIVSFLLYPFLSSTNNTQMQKHIADYFAFYAEDIEIKPFFDHDFKRYRAELNEKYAACTDRTWSDWWTWNVVAVDLFCKQWLSVLMHYWFHQEQNIAPSTTDMIVKFNLSGQVDVESAKAQFNQALQSAVDNFLQKLGEQGIELTDEDDIHVVDDYIKIKEQSSRQGNTSVYARITAPRFMDFRLAVSALAEQGIFIRKIAGQDHVQVKCKIEAPDRKILDTATFKLKQTKDTTLMYSYGDGVHSNRRYCLFDVPVKNMHNALDALEEKSTKDVNTAINFIHNF